jgi:hypothetical protein
MRLALFLLVAATPIAMAQQPAACTATQYRQFDFWLGEWDVTGDNGRRAGSNRIERILGGCVLYESWTGAGPSRGHSLNAWDSGDNKWHQTWMDNSGVVLLLSGGIVNGEMVMEGERRLANGTRQLERITWTPDTDGSVRQIWQSSRDGGMRWTTVFDGVYRKKQGSASR